MINGIIDQSIHNVYIYGAGEYGQLCKQYLEKAFNLQICGFLVTDVNANADVYCNAPIYSYTAARELSDACIIVCVSKKYWDDIRTCLGGIIEEKDSVKVLYAEQTDFCEMQRYLNPFNPSDFLLKATPVGRLMGTDRGVSISRYYITKFLNMATSRIEDKIEVTNEVAEKKYSEHYYPDAEHLVIDYKNSGDDLTDKSTLYHKKCDVFICTQVFNFIFDFEKAIEGASFIIKPNGYLLATVVGNISQISRYDMENWGDYWRYTTLSINKVVSSVFGQENTQVQAYGNSLAATAYIQGLSVEDLPDPGLLDVLDDEYALVIGIMAKKR